MSNAAITSISMDVFVLITFVGVFLYLMHIYRIWNEPSVGLWSAGALLASLSISFHLISVYILENADKALIYLQIAIILSFSSFWAFGISHMMARRSIFDAFGISILSIFLGILIHAIWTDESIIVISDQTFSEGSFSFSSNIALFAFLITLNLILARDSLLIYQASIAQKENTYHRSLALTHLLAWQFWGLGTIIIVYLSTIRQQLIFGFPFIFLLVPLITLSSRPFDWTREGHEPILLLLIDEYGTPTLSWKIDQYTPLLMEGSSIATIKTMLDNITHQTVQSMVVNYIGTSMYIKSSNEYLSLLITTGYHQSFSKLLSKIHQILIKSITKPSEFGLLHTEMPNELLWLLKQLLPHKKFSLNDKKKFWKEYFITE